MSVPTIWDHQLSRKEAWRLCLLAISLHILPLLLAGLPYIDDIWRAQHAGQLWDIGSSWTGQGRVLADVFYKVLGFNTATLDLYPLPLLISTVIVSWALAGLAFHYYITPRVTALLVVLPLWLNPFFLQNLSYQYDGPIMALALAASVMAITQGTQHRAATLTAMGLIGAAASLYQVSINVFAGLCCIEAIRLVAADSSIRQIATQLAQRLIQLVGGCLLYLCTGYLFIEVPRTKMLALNQDWPGAMVRRLLITWEQVGLLITSGTAWLFFALLSLAALALVIKSCHLLRSARPLTQRLTLLMFLWLPVAAVVVLVPGMALLFDYYNEGARMLMGLGPAMVLVVWLAHDLLTGLHRRLGWLMGIPLVFMLSFSYAYGRLLVAQKELERVVTSSIAQAIHARPALYSAHRFYIHGYDTKQVWLPAGSGSLQAMPALREVLAVGYQVLPEMMPRVGMTHFGFYPPLDRAQVLALSPQPEVDEKFFSIYRVGDAGYVLMKPLLDPDVEAQ